MHAVTDSLLSITYELFFSNFSWHFYARLQMFSSIILRQMDFFDMSKSRKQTSLFRIVSRVLPRNRFIREYMCQNIYKSYI